MVRRLRRGQDISAKLAKLGTQDLCYVALAVPRYDLLPAKCPDAVEAWHHLRAERQLSVCHYRGWPGVWVWEDTARPLADLRDAWATLSEVGVPWRGRLNLHSVTGRINELAAERDRWAEHARQLERELDEKSSGGD